MLVYFVRREIELFFFVLFSLALLLVSYTYIYIYTIHIYFSPFFLFMYVSTFVCASLMYVVYVPLPFQSIQKCIHLSIFHLILIFRICLSIKRIYVYVLCSRVAYMCRCSRVALYPKLYTIPPTPYGLQFCVRVDMHRARGISFCILHVFYFPRSTSYFILFLILLLLLLATAAVSNNMNHYNYHHQTNHPLLFLLCFE